MKVKVISLPNVFLVLYVLCFTRPRYQVSVYRTIGPLVLISLALFVYPNTLSYQNQTVLCCYTFDSIFQFDTEMLSEGGIKKLYMYFYFYLES